MQEHQICTGTPKSGSEPKVDNEKELTPGTQPSIECKGSSKDGAIKAPVLIPNDSGRQTFLGSVERDVTMIAVE